MKLTLNTWERMYLLQLISGMRNVPLASIRKGIKAMDALEMSEEEKATVGYQQTPEGAAWQDPDHQFVIDFRDKEAGNIVISRLKLEVEAKNKQDGWSMGDLNMLRLCEKLDIDVEA